MDNHALKPTMRIAVEQPLDLASSLESGQSHRWRRNGASDSDEMEVSHWGVVHGKLIQIWSRMASLPEFTHSLELRSAPHIDPSQMKRLLQSYLRLDEDIEVIYRDIIRDPRVAQMVEQYRGLRLLRIEPWECLISFICSANSNLPRIHANMETLSENFGQRLELDGYVRYSFPSPYRLAEVGEAELRRLSLGFRAPYVDNAAKTVARGDLDLESLRHMPYQEAKARLIELPGIGSKIADCVLLHSLDKLEAFPIDVWIRRALKDWYFQGVKPPPDKEMLDWAQDYFGPYAGYAELYLFHGRRLTGRAPKGD